jgi:transcriptional regulator with XRE-family HTH domain
MSVLDSRAMGKAKPTPNRLRVARAERDWPQYKLAGLARMHASRLSQIEHGQITPHPDEQARLAAALKCTVAELFPDQKV